MWTLKPLGAECTFNTPPHSVPLKQRYSLLMHIKHMPSRSPLKRIQMVPVYIIKRSCCSAVSIQLWVVEQRTLVSYRRKASIPP